MKHRERDSKTELNNNGEAVLSFNRFHFTYSFNFHFLVSCDFELNTCSWQNIKQDDMFDWQRHQASTPTLLTGPPHDNTRKSKYGKRLSWHDPSLAYRMMLTLGFFCTGTYMYIETTGRKPGDKAWLISPTLQATKNQCLRFYYYMVGTDIGQLNVNIRVTGSKNITRLWNLAGSRKAEWIEASVPLNFNTSSEVKTAL